MSGPYLRGEESSGKEKTEEHVQRFAGKKKQAVKTLSLNDGSQAGKGKNAQLLLKTDGFRFIYMTFIDSAISI